MFTAAFYEDIALDDEDYKAVKRILRQSNTSDFEMQVEDPGIHTRGPSKGGQAAEVRDSQRKQILKDKRMLKQFLQEKKKELRSKCTNM